MMRNDLRDDAFLSIKLHVTDLAFLFTPYEIYAKSGMKAPT